jgi:hypothetical protein
VSYTPSGPGSAALFSTTESIIACPVAREIKYGKIMLVDKITSNISRARNLVGLPTYRYQYAGNFSNLSPVGWMGAYHSGKSSNYCSG